MHVKRVLKASQNSVWGVPKPVKIETWDGPGCRNAAVKLHRAAKRQPRASKKCPRDAQEASKRGHEAPKSAQKPVKSRPRDRQTFPASTPRRVFSTIVVRSYIRQALETILDRCVARAQSLPCVKHTQT